MSTASLQVAFSLAQCKAPKASALVLAHHAHTHLCLTTLRAGDDHLPLLPQLEDSVETTPRFRRLSARKAQQAFNTQWPDSRSLTTSAASGPEQPPELHAASAQDLWSEGRLSALRQVLHLPLFFPPPFLSYLHARALRLVGVWTPFGQVDSPAAARTSSPSIQGAQASRCLDPFLRDGRQTLSTTRSICALEAQAMVAFQAASRPVAARPQGARKRLTTTLSAPVRIRVLEVFYCKILS